jgi:ubiquitin-like 1-activating enzyme E1 B
MGSEEFPKLIFEKVFKTDIERLRSMEDMWKTRKRPVVLEYDEEVKETSDIDPSIAQNDQINWTLAQNLVVFSDSVKRLSARLKSLQSTANGSGPAPVISFDKDDEDTLDFVAAAANCRSIVFNIETKSKFDIKQMAGNIIPAIATTNAMTAGLCVLQAFKVLKGEYHKARMVRIYTFGLLHGLIIRLFLNAQLRASSTQNHYDLQILIALSVELHHLVL